ncbi:nucleoside monophosphate kinase [archaeon]|nr:nucleoside monophosphate kinase [archaeon]
MNILLIGKPGAGKGTITKLLEENGEFLQLSTGDLLRMEITTGSELGKEIDELLKQGKFASDEIIFKIVGNFLADNSSKSIIFDGFPRNLKQAKSCFDNGVIFDKVFLIDVEDDILAERVINRRVHAKSGRVYNLKTMPPKVEGLDDVTGEPLMQRNDDRPEILERRLEAYKEQTQPILEYLKFKGIDVLNINGVALIDDQISQVRRELKKTSKNKI